MDLSHALAGLGLGFSLIIAIGAQNVFVLRQGIRREHAFAVAAVCAVSDLILIVLGVSGIGAVLTAVPWLIDAVRWAGAAFLVGYGVLAARRAIRPSGEVLVVEAESQAPAPAGTGTPRPAAGSTSSATASADAEILTASRRVAVDTPEVPRESPHPRAGRGGRASLAAVVGTCLALTWLNPHVYLDTVFLLGSVANSHGDGRWAFAAGAGAASVVWFFSLAYGARWLGRWLSTPRAWRILDAVIAVVMVAIAVSLVLPH
ncbi:L-lysine exporter [Agromyces sp. MMS24-K17]|uniref:L-lysine exporter n=1 Tax=Agromyces sp. MMS24-K17 TaxID=3372850 RepID=UPI003754068D